VVDEDAPHGLRRSHQVIGLGCKRAVASELQERFVDERRRVKRLPWLLRCQLGRRKLAELVAHLGHEIDGVHSST
jgi:hypothetical protein